MTIVPIPIHNFLEQHNKVLAMSGLIGSKM
jgi:hypothetical protein